MGFSIQLLQGFVSHHPRPKPKAGEAPQLSKREAGDTLVTFRVVRWSMFEGRIDKSLTLTHIMASYWFTKEALFEKISVNL